MTGASVNGRTQRLSDVGFVGLGRMGGAMAANLVAAGHRIVGFARRPADASLGVEIAAGISDLFECGIVVSMLPGDEAVVSGEFSRGSGTAASNRR